jgi:hypothetical protein
MASGGVRLKNKMKKDSITQPHLKTDFGDVRGAGFLIWRKTADNADTASYLYYIADGSNCSDIGATGWIGVGGDVALDDQTPLDTARRTFIERTGYDSMDIYEITAEIYIPEKKRLLYLVPAPATFTGNNGHGTWLTGTEMMQYFQLGTVLLSVFLACSAATCPAN